MFNAVKTQIRRLPWWGQAVAWPLYAAFWMPAAIIGWAFQEMYGSAKSGAKKVFAPLALPAAAFIGLAVLYASLGGAFGSMFGPVLHLLLTIGLMFFGLKVAVSGFLGGSKKKKKK